jgi:hypothetical protein
MHALKHPPNVLQAGMLERFQPKALLPMLLLLMVLLPEAAEACQTSGTGCSVFYPCCDGLSCQPGVHKVGGWK